MKKKILFLIHDLGPGGAEKVLVNLVNALDRNKFDISLRTLFDWGPNRAFLLPDIHYSCWFGRNIPANSHWMKLWTPEQLYKKIIPGDYDIVVSFLEGPCARVSGGSPKNGAGPKTICWIHTPILNKRKFREGFRDEKEAASCYEHADALVFVSRDVRDAFEKFFTPQKRSEILYNIFESGKIRELAAQSPEGYEMDPELLNWCGMGKLIPLKGWSRLLDIQYKLRQENIPSHFYLIGEGPQRKELEQKAAELGIRDSVTFTGYRTNPYSTLSRCMLFACASEREGLSTSVIESLLVGTPVCTVDVGGMREILGSNNEYGVVSANDDVSLYQAIRPFFTEPPYREAYAKMALIRGRNFDHDQAVRDVESFLLSL